jgi:hypothetical protein
MPQRRPSTGPGKACCHLTPTPTDDAFPPYDGATRLWAAKLRPLLDKWHVVPENPWISVLEHTWATAKRLRWAPREWVLDTTGGSSWLSRPSLGLVGSGDGSSRHRWPGVARRTSSRD